MKNLFALLLLSVLAIAYSPLQAQDAVDQQTEQTDNLDQVFDFYLENPDAPQLIAQADVPGDEQVAPDNTPDMPTDEPDTEYSFWAALWDWIKSNWAESILGLFAFIEVIVTLTPTDRDNAWFRWLRDLIQKIIPNNKAGGGTHA